MVSERSVPEVSEDARAIHRAAIVIDGCSFFLRGYNERVQRAGLTAINFTVPLPWDDAATGIDRIRQYYEVVRRDPRIAIAWTTADIERCTAEGKLAAIIGCQNSRIFGTELAYVEIFWRLGLRVVQLTYNERNFAGDGCLEPADAGLSFFGRRLIRELNDFGLVLDLAHCGVRTSLEAMAASERPVIISHAGIRAFVDSPRAIGDEQLRAVAATGGVVGVTSFAPFNWRGGPERPHLADFVQALEHAIEVAGVDHVGVGTDHVVEPGGYPQWVRDYSAMIYTDYSTENAERTRGFREVAAGVSADDQLVGFEGMQDFPRLTQALLDRGHPEEDVRKVLGGNFLRVFRSVWRPGGSDSPGAFRTA